MTRVFFPIGEPLLPGKARFIAIVHTALALARMGGRVTLLLPGPPAAVARYAAEDLGAHVPPGFDVVPLGGLHRALGHPFTWNALIARSARRTIARIRAGGSAVVHVRHEKIAEALAGGPAPLVFEAHAIPADYERERGGKASRVAAAERRTRAILGGAAGLAAITRGLLDDLVGRYGFRGPTAVARSGIDLDRFPHAWPDSLSARGSAGAPVILYAGRLGAWKAVPTLVLALAAVPGARLRILAAGDQEEVARLRALARDHGVADRVDIEPRVAHREVAARIAEATVAAHVLPADLSIARRDTSPLKLLEYFATGVPVVAPDVPAVREIATDGRDALLVKPGDTAALAAALRRLLEDAALRDRLGRAGRVVAETLSWDSRARTLLELHERALREPSR